MPTAPQNTDELYAGLQENQQRPYGRARTIAAEELTDAAEQLDDPLALVRALLALQEAYTYGAEPRKAPVVFARLLNLFDEQPDIFTEQLRHLLFWRFKWVANALRALPEIPLSALRQWLTEMRDRYEKAGLGLQPYYGQVHLLAAHAGTDDATTAYELWAARSRTPLSDCEACEICERALHHLATGDDARALRTWEPVLDGKESCQEEPARSFSHALLPLLRTGDTERARAVHLAGYRGSRRNPSMAGEVGRHLEFCALTGNEARGLELLAENRVLFEDVDSPEDQYDFLTGVEVLLQRVERLGHAELPVAGYAGRTWTVAALRTEVRGRADDLAARFDARNGTTAHADRRRTRLDRAPLLDRLELTLRVRTLDDLSPADPVAAPAAPQTPALPESVPELVARARELEQRGHPEAQLCWARLRTLITAPGYTHPDDPVVGPLVRLRADLLADEAARAGDGNQPAEAADLYEEAAGLYEDAALPGEAAVAAACGALAEAEAADGDGPEKQAAALTAVHARTVRLHEETPGLAPYQEGRLLRLRATALGLRFQAVQSEEHAAAAYAEVELLHAFAARHGLASQTSGAALLRAGTRAISGDLPAAVTELDALVDLLREHGPAWHLPRTLGLRGRLRIGLRDAEEAYTDLAEAVRLAAEWPVTVAETAGLHGDLAETCMYLGRPEEALRQLTRSAELDLRRDQRARAYCTYSNAAELSLDLGRVEDTIALLDSVLAEPDVADGGLDDRLTAQLRLIRARALHAGDDLKAATAEFVALAAESAGWDDDPGSHAMIAAETAVLLGEAGDFGPAREALAQALAAHGRAPRYEQLSNALRELARLQAEQQGPDGLADALAHLAEAGRIADAARAAAFEPRGRSLDTALAYEHGRVHAYAGQYEESLAALEKAVGQLGEPGPDRFHAAQWAECVRLAAVVEGVYLERTAPALARLDTAIARLTPLGHTEETGPLAAVAAQLREES
ncbi:MULTISPECIES: hypothetical protein [unclassified Streptomyces]|uniref:hypothetical protein n=1 Tax=unclassified Streptomyces TaxID=2593676 RepID=UPI000DAD05F2|nr:MULTISPECIES: hypothetical protein [unclassified Streptomyces]PZT73414.1 hypothetical protein DNK55_14050 [Streptomyces sp. AC1-42T]PZT83598.1 hypothetical protein DNK56_17375 [Streptomyces sp. AC1-42W]